MKIDCTEQVELPFMLNIPSGIYPVGGAASPYLLQVAQSRLQHTWKTGDLQLAAHQSSSRNSAIKSK